MTNHAGTDFDLIVVGAGHNGLTCAAYVAEAGFSVCVVERQPHVGGAAVTEEFHPGFRNSAASYTVSLLQPKVIQDLGLADHGLRILPRPLDNFVPSRDGPGLRLPGETGARLESIREHSHRDAARYLAFARELDAVLEFVKPMLLEAPLNPAASWSECEHGLRLLGRALRAGPRAWAAAPKLLMGNAGDWLDKHFESDLLKGALGFDSIVGHFASPYDAGSAYLLLHHALGELNGRAGAWGHAVGGMGSISDALAAAAVSRGAVIKLDCPVTSVVGQRGDFEVHHADGILRSRAVACAIHPRTFFLDLLANQDELPQTFKQQLSVWRSESATFRMNVALSELPNFTCSPGRVAADHHGSGILITPSLGYLHRAHESALATGISSAPVVEVVIPSTIDASLAPKGAHVASLFCQHFRYALPDGAQWADKKAAVVDRIINKVTEYAPNFRRSVIAVSARSPVDLESHFGLVGGDIFHGAMTRDQLYWSRPARGFAQYRSPLAHLYMCASGAHPGGGVSAAPGHNAAMAIVADLNHVPAG